MIINISSAVGNSESSFPELFTVDIQKVLRDLRAWLYLWPRWLLQEYDKVFY